MNLPDTHQTVMPYLIIKDAPAFSKYAENVFGATETLRSLQEGTDIIRHAQIMIGQNTIMFSEASEQFAATDSHLFIYVDNADKTYEAALAEGGFSIMPPADQHYGRSCGIKDPFGTTWWITSL